MSEERKKPEVFVGWKATTTVTVTDKMIHQFAEMSGDFNPIHMSEEYAQATRFKKRIAHGMISAAIISRSLNENIGPGGVYLSQNLKFINPVYIDDTITVELEMTSLRKERGIGSVTTNVKNQKGEFVVKGDAMILMLS